MQATSYHRLDSIFLNKIFSIPIFFFIMYLMFVFTINIGGAFQDFFNLSSRAIFIEGTKFLVGKFNLPHILEVILADGVGFGISVAISFIPVLFCMFLFLAFLEASGYIARAALVMNKFMRFLGLPGEAFVPMIVGFGCNVPAVLGTKGLKNRDDRILTIIMTPFMSCSARLAIYTVFVAAFFSSAGHNVIFALYLIGIVAAILTGIFLRNTILKANNISSVTELPRYQFPRLYPLVAKAGLRLKRFITKAMQLIIPFCIIFSILGSVKSETSGFLVLEKVGKAITPIFKPMGIQQENWPAVVGLLSGMVAKEVMIGSLGALYGNDINSSQSIKNYGEIIPTTLKQAVTSIPQNLSQIKSTLLNPILNSKPDVQINNGVLGVIYTKFGSPYSAFSYLTFILLYFPCISVVVAIAKELNRYWAAFSVVWSTGVAYITATVFYQTVTFLQHPITSSYWIIMMLLCCSVGFFGLKELAKRRKKGILQPIYVNTVIKF